MSDDCIFCKIIRGEIPCEKIYEDKKVIIFLDHSPVNPGHSLVVPKKHFEKMLENHQEYTYAMMDAIKKVIPGIMKATNAEGWNLGVNNGKAAGQAVLHTHFHIIPRFSNDGLKHWPNKAMTDQERKNICEKIKAQL